MCVVVVLFVARGIAPVVARGIALFVAVVITLFVVVFVAFSARVGVGWVVSVCCVCLRACFVGSGGRCLWGVKVRVWQGVDNA